MATTELPAVQAPAGLETEIEQVVAWAKALEISTADGYQDAAGYLKSIKGMAKRVEDFFKPMKRAQDEAKKRILEAEKKLAEPLAKAEGLAKRAMLDYQRQEEEKRQAEQRRLQAIADEKARKEREALERKAAQAKKPETQQKYAEAAAQVAAPVVAVEAATPTVAGIVPKKVWKARVVDPALIPREYLVVNEKALDALAKSLKEMAKVPGVEFYQESVLSASGR